MIPRPPRSTLSSSSAASDVYKRQRTRRSRGAPRRAPPSRSLRPSAAEADSCWRRWGTHLVASHRAARRRPRRATRTSPRRPAPCPVSYTHLRAHETPEHLVCRLLLEKKNPANASFETAAPNKYSNQYALRREQRK